MEIVLNKPYALSSIEFIGNIDGTTFDEIVMTILIWQRRNYGQCDKDEVVELLGLNNISNGNEKLRMWHEDDNKIMESSKIVCCEKTNKEPYLYSILDWMFVKKFDWISNFIKGELKREFRFFGVFKNHIEQELERYILVLEHEVEDNKHYCRVTKSVICSQNIAKLNKLIKSYRQLIREISRIKVSEYIPINLPIATTKEIAKNVHIDKTREVVENYLPLLSKLDIDIINNKGEFVGKRGSGAKGIIGLFMDRLVAHGIIEPLYDKDRASVLNELIPNLNTPKDGKTVGQRNCRDHLQK
ncbi:MAG: hypothetical protein AAF688_15480, partial [Bacteroidota bacterium]